MYDMSDGPVGLEEYVFFALFILALLFLAKGINCENNSRLPETKTEFSIASENCPKSKQN